MDDTLQSAKDWVDTNSDKGVICPCCDSFVKLYKRKFNSGMAKMLTVMYNAQHLADSDGWIHILDFKFNSNSFEYSKLKHWELIEPKPKDDKDKTKKASGYWRITQKGKDFIEGKTSIPDRVILFNNTIEGFSTTLVKITDVLKVHFDYRELMRD